jgi:RHS repeat-associated protein
MTSRAPEPNGSCKTTGGQVQSYSYDAADRLTGEEITYDSFGRITSLPGQYAGGSALETTFYNNNMVASQTQSGVTNSYKLDATGRVRERIRTGGGNPTEIFHYATPSDLTAWIDRGSSWVREIGGIGGGLAAIQQSTGEVALQLTNLHGDVVATTGVSSSETKPTASYEYDEFGRINKGGFGRYGWLGVQERRTELASGAVQMGVRNYIPALGRFISPDPVEGGSANAYDYANADPVNQSDPSGSISGCGVNVKVESHDHRIYAYGFYDCSTEAWPFGHSLIKAEGRFERETKGWWDETFIGEFEMKGHWSWKPPNPSNPRWRHWRVRENWYCGDLGREYRITYILSVMYSSPVNGVLVSHTEEVSGSGRVKCLQ